MNSSASASVYDQVMIRSTVLLAIVLGVALQATPHRPITMKDTSGTPWTLLAPDEHHLDLLFFLATDCPISNRYAPEIHRICADYHGRGVRCFTVYPESNADAITAHRREYGFGAAIPAIVDHDHALVVA